MIRNARYSLCFIVGFIFNVNLVPRVRMRDPGNQVDLVPWFLAFEILSNAFYRGDIYRGVENDEGKDILLESMYSL